MFDLFDIFTRQNDPFGRSQQQRSKCVKTYENLTKIAKIWER